MPGPPVQIAYVLNSYPLPSHSFIWREIQALERRGVVVTRIAMRRPGMPFVEQRGRDEEVRTTYALEHRVLLVRSFLSCLLRQPIRSLRALLLAVRCGRASSVGLMRHLIYLVEATYVEKACRDHDVDHMHAHFGTNSAMVAMLTSVLGGPGFSFTVHGPEEFDAPAALSLGLKTNAAAFTVAVSQFGRSQLCRWAEFDAWRRISVVHCGIEPAAYEKIEPMPKGPLRLVSIGRLVEQKGQMALVNAMARLRHSHPEIHVTLVGDGEMRSDLEKAVTDQGLEEQVSFSGWLDQKGVKSELDGAHAIVMPSFAEGLPMVIMEAMAAARPVIATSIAGIPELVEHGQTGWLVPAGDEDGLAKAISNAAEQTPDRLEQMGQLARQRVLTRHDIDIEAKKLHHLFEQARGNTY
ncbi:MAG: glycosyltransferase family 4 protein [Pseudomonadota bacterium]